MFHTILNVLVIFTIHALNSAGPSLQYSNNVIEDSNLLVPELITKYGYPSEVHHVTTQDGYILELHRIPYGRDANNDPNTPRPAVLLMHGLFASSAVWVLSGPGSALGYQLAEEGYDVWLGNTRGNKYSGRHVRLNSDSLLNTAFWEFSWEQNGQYDVPAIIDFVLSQTGQEKLHYIGHSMGTTMIFTMGTLRPEYNQKIISITALAPVAYMAHNQNPLLRLIAPLSTSIKALASLIGVGEFLPNSAVFRAAGQALCQDKAITQSVCTNILFLVSGWDEGQLNATILPIIFGHTPAGSSVKQLAHYGQSIASGRFRRYDYGTPLSNYQVYGSITPPKFDVSKITVPVFLHYSTNDRFAEVEDVQKLYGELNTPKGLYLVADPQFSHLDYVWGIDAKTLVYDRVLNILQAIDSNTFNEADINNY